MLPLESVFHGRERLGPTFARNVTAACGWPAGIEVPPDARGPKECQEMMRVLVVATSVEDRGLLAERFRSAGHECECVASGRERPGQDPPSQYDVVIVDDDLPMPDVGGLSRCGAATARGRPKLLLSRAILPEGRATDLPEVLRAVARALDDGHAADGRRVRFEDLLIDPTNLRAIRAGEDLWLTPTEFRVLEVLLTHAGTTVSRQMLCEHVWSRDWHGVTNVVDVYVSRVRRKVDHRRKPLIHTVRGVGYRIGQPE